MLHVEKWKCPCSLNLAVCSQLVEHKIQYWTVLQKLMQKAGIKFLLDKLKHSLFCSRLLYFQQVDFMCSLLLRRRCEMGHFRAATE